MRRGLKLLVIVLLVGLPWPAWGQDILINPVPPDVKPRWTPVPGVPQVAWAPNLPTDVFRFRGKYFFYWEGYFYQGRAPQGPWKAVTKVPKVIYGVDPAYFKTVKQEATAPAAPAEPALEHKAKIIDLPPPTPPPSTPEPPPPTLPVPPGAPPPPPQVM